MISFVIDQSLPGVFYLQKNDEFHETRGLLPSKNDEFHKTRGLLPSKMMNFMKMRTFYIKLPLFIEKLNFAYL